jgi:hypothetical protein
MTWMSPVAVTKTSPIFGGLGHGHDAEAVHDGLERPQRVDLGTTTSAPCPFARIATPRPHQP